MTQCYATSTSDPETLSYVTSPNSDCVVQCRIVSTLSMWA